MVVACEVPGATAGRISETVAVVERPAHQQATVYSELVYTSNRRFKEQVDFRPVLHPVKYSDTAYLWLNNTRRRFVSRTYYEPRVRPRAYSETTIARPKVAEERFVSCLDARDDEKRKWYKTSVEIEPRKFTSAKVIRSANNNYIGTENGGDLLPIANGDMANPVGELDGYHSHEHETNGIHHNGVQHEPLPLFQGHTFERGAPHPCNQSDVHRAEPGASQVYIPKRLQRRGVDLNCVTNGEDLLIDLVSNNTNGNHHPFHEDNPSHHLNNHLSDF